ncbi:aldehyde dehydrogenase (NADP(+)) [Microbacterium sp.]|uniref:aldehyde dehydrogenase (NADP(+)) n=1 Tax=Microbacterium sp. TaxID=51671 RepID=UPI003A8DC65B
MTTVQATAGSFIAGDEVVQGTGQIQSVDPATGQTLEPVFALATAEQVQDAVDRAREAGEAYRATTAAERRALLESIAAQLEAVGDELVERAHLESGLPLGRLRGELGRTTGQFRFLGSTLTDDALHVDDALPERTPPRPELVLRSVPIGTVVVFGSSNFPLAFSNAGGDTASALAAGCPVIVKNHEAHLGTTRLVSRAISAAVKEAGLPGGVYSALTIDRELAGALVANPLVDAVGFTGSRRAGLALRAIADRRPVPIPVYAEMSSINPVVVLPGAATAETADGFVDSLTLGSGQFCTQPGVLFVPNDADRFLGRVAERIDDAAGQTMLTSGIAAAFADGIRRQAESATLLAEGRMGEGANAPAPVVYDVALDAFDPEGPLSEEVFGASSVIVRYDSVDDVLAALRRLDGQLTGTVHATDAEITDAGRVVSALERIVGRIVFNGWPTGVEVAGAMVHGGPYPATSEPRTTSVGALAIERFRRPVSYQNVPAGLLQRVGRRD